MGAGFETKLGFLTALSVQSESNGKFLRSRKDVKVLLRRVDSLAIECDKLGTVDAGL